MGACSSREFVTSSDIPGRDDVAVEVFKNIGLSKYEVNKFFMLYNKIDCDHSGLISSTELFNYLRLETTELAIKMFNSFDIDGNARLDFCEFTLSMWNFLTLSTNLLPSLVFYLFDSDNNRELDWFEVKSIVETIHTTSALRNAALKRIIDDMQFHAPFSHSEFNKYCYDNPYVYQPLTVLQLSWRERMLGNAFWSRLISRRVNNVAQQQPDYASRLITFIKEKIQERKAMKRMAKRERARQNQWDRLQHRKTTNKSYQREDMTFEYFSNARQRTKSVHHVPVHKKRARRTPVFDAEPIDMGDADDNISDSSAADSSGDSIDPHPYATMYAAVMKSLGRPHNLGDLLKPQRDPRRYRTLSKDISSVCGPEIQDPKSSLKSSQSLPNSSPMEDSSKFSLSSRSMTSVETIPPKKKKSVSFNEKKTVIYFAPSTRRVAPHPHCCT
mmetsp:Transcript_15873/g.23906  ORF Transcript_15873/g.23906 Transcript_15873/m.23906 type:complete len:443 (-) Transcript_15873:342-1670(-)